MTTHGAAAKSARLSKERHPEHFCAHVRCLWRTREVLCPRHTVAGMGRYVSDGHGCVERDPDSYYSSRGFD